MISGAARAATPDTNWCQPKTTPAVSIMSDTNRITWVYNKSSKVLNKSQIDTVNPYGNSVITDVGGLMHGGIKMDEKMEFGTLTNSGTGETCIYYNKIDVGFHIFPTIYIASEYPQNSCMFNAIRAHELKHINVDRDIVNRYAKGVGQAIQAEIKRQYIYGPAPTADKVALQMTIKQRMEGIMKVYSDAMDAERRKRQQDVDNLQEYERVNHLCDKR